MTYWQSSHFKAMQQAWYAKLKAEGFEDAEEMIAGEMVLRQIAAHPYRDLNHLSITTKEAYYRILGQRVQGSAFDNDIDRVIMTMLAGGSKRKRIIEELKSQGKSRCRETIRVIIRKYEMIWGLRKPRKSA